MCCTESQITGSPPLLSDLDILCEMEHEGHGSEHAPIIFPAKDGDLGEYILDLKTMLA